MPSVGLEFITKMGVHIPEYVESGLEMHINIYHESSLKAKVNIKRNQIKLSIPAPKSNTQLLSIRSVAPAKWHKTLTAVAKVMHSHSLCLKYSNKLLSVSSGQTNLVPSLVEDRTDSTDCQPLFSGLKFCTIVRYSNATFIESAPYYPLTGETRWEKAALANLTIFRVVTLEYFHSDHSVLKKQITVYLGLQWKSSPQGRFQSTLPRLLMKHSKRVKGVVKKLSLWSWPWRQKVLF